MDIAYYLSELLEQPGEVSVPGLGSFTRVKVDGYYNESEGRFYPPTSKIQFSTHYVDDDVLTRYIGVKKRISLASSKYFTEKYISNLRLEIMAKDVVFADLGTLYFADGELQFKPAADMNETVFYGYPPITLNKIDNETAYNWDEQVTTDTIPVAEPEREPEPEVEERSAEELPVIISQDEDVVEEEPVLQHEEQAADTEVVQEEPVVTGEPAEKESVHDQQAQYTPPHTEEEDDFIFHHVPYEEQAVQEEEEIPERSYKWVWITLLVLIIAGGGIYAYIYFNPFQHKTAIKKVQPLVSKDTTDSIASSDTLKTIQSADTSVKPKNAATLQQNAALSTIDSTKVRYEVIGTETRTLAEAKKRIANYKTIGLDAHVVTDATGKRLKISVGTYATKAEAVAAANKLSGTNTIKGAWTLQINPKK